MDYSGVEVMVRFTACSNSTKLARVALFLAVFTAVDQPWLHNEASNFMISESSLLSVRMGAVREFDKVHSVIMKDKRGGSRVGRRKKKKRLECRWWDQYLSENAVYDDKHFREAFGVSKSVFHFFSMPFTCLSIVGAQLTALLALQLMYRFWLL